MIAAAMRFASALTFLISCLVALPSPVLAAPPWEEQFMTAPPRKVLDAAAEVKAPTDAEVVMLLQDEHVVYGDNRAVQRVFRQAYLVRSEAAVQHWSEIQASWEPWIGNKPSLKARVVARDGRVFNLDPRTIEATTIHDNAGDIYTDRSLLRAPLPGVGRGAVVELEVASQEKVPLFDQGVVDDFLFVSDIPTERTRLVLDAPASLPIKFTMTNGDGIRRTEKRSGDRIVLTFEGGPLAPRDPLFPGAPPNLYQSSFVSYTTAQSWQRVAVRYGEIVDEQLRGADVGALARETVRGLKGRDAIASALLARIRQDIRYSGLEFGESSIVPHTPSDVLGRRLGDCKDQATLLVALLRAAGIEAHVALLRAGVGHDSDPQLPGLGTFNHAIVYVPARQGTPDLWIDPIARFTPLGELPITDQGRLALVIRPATTKLVLTPVAPGSANLTREERDISLSEDGKVALTELTTYHGVDAARFRSNFYGAEHKDLEKNLTNYATEHYKAKKLNSFEVSEPTDLTHPLTITLNIDGAELAYAGGETAQVTLYAAPLFHDLPDEIRDPDDAAKSLPQQLKGRERTVDFLYVYPFASELVYRIKPAHGFVVQALPPAQNHTFGPAKLDFTCTALKNGTIEARFRFDSGKTRLSPAELRQFQDGFKAFADSVAPTVRFTLAAEKELEAGQTMRALAELRRLDGEHPNTAHHAAQLARAFLAAGLGEAARREARRATALDPKSGEAWRMLGTVLEHDAIGRIMKPGWDRAGAEAAFEKAAALDAKDAQALHELALMAEYDDEGLHTWPTQRLKQAKALYERYQKAADKTKEYSINYLITLFRLGNYQDVLQKFRLATKGTDRYGLALAATAVLRGPAEAIRQSTEIVPDGESRAEALREGGAELLAIRRYSESLALYSEAARTHPQAAAIRQLMESIRRTKPRETQKLDERDPRQAVAIWLASMAGIDSNSDSDTKRIMADGELPAGIDMRMLKAAFRTGINRSNSAKVPLSVLIDFAVSRERLQEGDPRWCVWVRGANGEQPMLVVPRDGKFRLLFTGADTSPALAREALRRIEQRDLDGARYLLKELNERLPAAKSDDPFEAPVFRALWRSGQQQDEQHLRLLALAAQNDPDRDRELLPLLENAIRTGAGEFRDACERVSINVLWRLGRKSDATSVAEKLANRFPSSRKARLILAEQAVAQKQWDKAQEIVQKLLKDKPDDEMAQQVFRSILYGKDQIAEALDVLGKSLATSSKPDVLHNQMAWTALFLPQTDQHALEHARQAVSLTQRRESASLHTLATVLAELGYVDEARQTLVELFDLEGLDEPRDIDWYVIGRIAEHYGELRTALSAYKRLQSSPEPLSTFRLATRRMRVIEGERK